MTVLLLVATLAVTWQAQRRTAAHRQAQFDGEVTRIESAMRERMAGYAQVLRGGLALFEVSAAVAPDQWRHYVSVLDLSDRYPGFRSLDYVEALDPADLDAVRRDAVARATRAGTMVLSSRVPSAGQDRKAAFVAYLPVRRSGQPSGWLTADIAADAFLRDLFGSAAPILEFEVYDGERTGPGSLLYSTEGIGSDGEPRPLRDRASTTYARTSRIDWPGRSWTLRYRAAPQFAPMTDRLLPWLAFAGGILATWLFHLTASSAAVVRHQATHDALTGLANRSLFMKRVQATAEGSRRVGRHFALVFIDIDGFKAVNDRHGHRAGDQLLKAIAGRLRHGMRREDLLSRLGGDEFAAILAGSADPQADATRYGQRVVEQISKPFTLALPGGDVRVTVGASVGIAVHPQHGEGWDSLLVAADEAMYRAKRGGKGRCVLSGMEGATG